MKNQHTDVIAEYLDEVDLRLTGLPVLQRRELLADLAAHIATERTERNIQSEGELIDILERLGSPEVVAAAAYESAGPYRPAPAPADRTSTRPPWVIPVIVGAAILAIVLFCGAFFFSSVRSSHSEPATADVTATASAEPTPSGP